MICFHMKHITTHRLHSKSSQLNKTWLIELTLSGQAACGRGHRWHCYRSFMVCPFYGVSDCNIGHDYEHMICFHMKHIKAHRMHSESSQLNKTWLIELTLSGLAAVRGRRWPCYRRFMVRPTVILVMTMIIRYVVIWSTSRCIDCT